MGRINHIRIGTLIFVETSAVTTVLDTTDASSVTVPELTLSVGATTKTIDITTARTSSAESTTSLPPLASTPKQSTEAHSVPVTTEGPTDFPSTEPSTPFAPEESTPEAPKPTTTTLAPEPEDPLGGSNNPTTSSENTQTTPDNTPIDSTHEPSDTAVMKEASSAQTRSYTAADVTVTTGTEVTFNILDITSSVIAKLGATQESVDTVTPLPEAVPSVSKETTVGDPKGTTSYPITSSVPGLAINTAMENMGSTEVSANVTENLSEPMLSLPSPSPSVLYPDPSQPLAWEEWTYWSQCSGTCGQGSRLRWKLCQNDSNNTATCDVEMGRGISE